MSLQLQVFNAEQSQVKIAGAIWYIELQGGKNSRPILIPVIVMTMF